MQEFQSHTSVRSDKGNRTPWALPLDLPLLNNNVNSLEVGGKSLKSFEE